MSLQLTGRACPARPWNKAFPMPEAELLPQKPCATESEQQNESDLKGLPLEWGVLSKFRRHSRTVKATQFVYAMGSKDIGARLRSSLLTLVLDIWLILPVVICLSQRLSHACVSTCLYIVKLRMAH